MEDEDLRMAKDSILELLAEMREENDRAVVIVGAAYIDDLLKRMLHSSLLPPIDKKEDELMGSHSSLASFSARIDLCYRIALIDKELRQLLHLMRRVRNDFAHKFKGCDLNSQPHSNRVNELVKQWKGLPVFEKVMKVMPDGSAKSREFRVALSLITVLLEMKIRTLPKTLKANPASISWIPSDVDL